MRPEHFHRDQEFLLLAMESQKLEVDDGGQRTNPVPSRDCVLSQAHSLAWPWSPRTCLSWPLQCWDYRCVLQCSAFLRWFRRLNSGPHVLKATQYSSEHPLLVAGLYSNPRSNCSPQGGENLIRFLLDLTVPLSSPPAFKLSCLSIAYIFFFQNACS